MERILPPKAGGENPFEMSPERANEVERLYSKQRVYIGIIGTRRRDNPVDLKVVEGAFLNLCTNVILHEPDLIVSGGCPKGGDRFAEVIARKYQVPIIIFYARWRRFNKAAGFMRNSSIAEMTDYLIACVAEDRKGGTEDTIKKFLKRQGEEKLILV